MVNASAELLALRRHDYKTYADVTFADGSELSLTPENFALTGNTVIDGAQEMAFPLGSAISRTIQLNLINRPVGDGSYQWDGYDFFGAIIDLTAKIELSETTEIIPFGRFTVVTPQSVGDTIKIQAQDAMWRADVDYVPTTLAQNTLGYLFQDVCVQSGLPYESLDFDNSETTISNIPEGQTCRQMFGYIAMLAGGNCRIDRDGYVQIMTYSFDHLNDDGVTNGYIHDLKDWKSVTTDTGDITITGISCRVGEDTVLVGEEGYVLSVINPLIQDWEEDALQLIGGSLIGASFRKFSGNYFANPLMDFMDGCRIQDVKGRYSFSIITDIDFTFFGFTKVANSAVSDVYNRSVYTSPATDAAVLAERLVAKEKTEREVAIEQLNQILANSSGLYSTEEMDSGARVALYLHDKPRLLDSVSVIKVTSEAIGFSPDGIESCVENQDGTVSNVVGAFPFGLTVNGDVIANILSARGINADWIRTGSIAVTNNGKVLFKIDFDNNEAVINQELIEGIKVGIVGFDENHDPIYGVAVGQNMTLSDYEVGGEVQTLITGSYRGVFTANKLSFYIEDTEAAYFSGHKMFIPTANITDALQVGVTNNNGSKWTITHDNGFAIKWTGGSA